MIINQGGGRARVQVTVTQPPVKSDYPTLSTGRNNLVAGADGNGNPIFIGGIESGTSGSTTVDRFDKFGNPLSASKLGTARYSAAVATDGLGNIIHAGGNPTNTTNSNIIDRFDMNGNRTNPSTLSTARGAPSAATDGNGDVLIAGGQITSSLTTVDVVDKYYKDTGQTVKLAVGLSEPRLNLGAATDGFGNVLFGGGRKMVGGSVTEVAVVDRFDVIGNRVILEPLSGTGPAAGVTDGNGNVIFASQKKTVDRYSPSGIKTTLDPLVASDNTYAPVATNDGSGNVYIAGLSIVDPTVTVYTKSGVRSTLSLSVPRVQMAATRDGEGRALFGGGSVSGAKSNVVDCFNDLGRKSIAIPAFNAYRFQEHASEQPAQPTDTTVKVDAPNQGYFRQTNGSITF